MAPDGTARKMQRSESLFLSGSYDSLSRYADNLRFWQVLAGFEGQQSWLK
jgi:hypothetical protein